MSAPSGFAASMRAHAPERAERLLVLFGDQLDAKSPALAELDRERDAVLMVEAREESSHVPSHRQRTVLFLAAMRHFALELAGKGFRVRYISLDDPANTGSLDGEVRRAVKALGVKKLIVQRPGEHRVMAMAAAWKKSLVETEIVEDQHFLCSPKSFREWADGKKSLVMEMFYRRERKRLGVLMDDDGGPVGGAWNFDKENRRSFKTAPSAPAVYRARPDAITKEVIATVEREMPDLPGRLSSFGWGVTREEAKRSLADFVEHRLRFFGDHQDAMWTGEPFLYHSLLSPYVNLHLLAPMELVDPAVAALEAGKAPINAVEGFVRQVIGWREFIRGVYWLEGPSYETRNALDQHGRLPGFYWTGQTEMRCVRESVGQVLEHGYGHHIQRLMVTGNFALIAGVHPREVSDWYLGMYVDAVDWVTLPNTLGMAMHADGGVVGTKPYAASGKYIQKMSNYCKGCRYDPEKRTGEDACPFNIFYWEFLVRNEETLGANQRMALILSHVKKMTKREKVELTVSAGKLRETMGIGPIGKGKG